MPIALPTQWVLRIRLYHIIPIYIPVNQVKLLRSKLRAKKIPLRDFKGATKHKDAFFKMEGKGGSFGDDIPYVLKHRNVNRSAVRLHLREIGVSSLLVHQDVGEEGREISDVYTEIRKDAEQVDTQQLLRDLSVALGGSDVRSEKPYRFAIGFEEDPESGRHVGILEDYIKKYPSSNERRKMAGGVWRYVSKRFCAFVTYPLGDKRKRRRLTMRALQGIELALSSRNQYERILDNILQRKFNGLTRDATHTFFIQLHPDILSGDSVIRSPIDGVASSLYKELAEVIDLKSKFWATVKKIIQSTVDIQNVLNLMEAIERLPDSGRNPLQYSELYSMNFQLNKEEKQIIEFMRKNQEKYFELIAGNTFANTYDDEENVVRQIIRKKGGVLDSDISKKVFPSTVNNFKTRQLMNRLSRRNIINFRQYKGPGCSQRSRIYFLNLDLMKLKEYMLIYMAL